MVLLLQSHTVALNGFHHLLYRFVLRHDHLLQFNSHIAQAQALRLLHPLHGNTCHHRNDIGDMAFGDFHLFAHLAFFPAMLRLFEPLLALQLLIAKARSHLEVLIFYRVLLLSFDFLYLLLEIHNFLGHFSVLQVDMRANLVEHVDGLVREETIGDIAVGEFHYQLQHILRIGHLVMMLIAVFDISQNLQRLIRRGRFDHHLLKSALQCPIFFYGLAILIQGGRTDTLYGTPG
ncbi:hypothetical protein EVA_10476 [gut metagenome]|uniref:Uncharacterized protein n=1 Tax=gut metagenome TaxID=749906 RepID=J9GHP0_9ZZZZ